MAVTRLDSIEKMIANCFRYATLFGLSNYYYNFDTKKLVQCPRATAYCLIVDLTLGIVLPIVIYQDSGFAEVELFANRRIANALNNLLTFVNAIAVGVSLSSHWININRARLLFNRVNNIRLNDLAHLPQSKRILRQSEKLIYAKVICSAISVMGMFATFYFQTDNPKPMYILASIYITLVENVLVTVENQFYLGMIYTGYLFKTLNRHFSRIVNDMSSLCDRRLQTVLHRKSGLLCRELASIGQTHTNLYNLTLAMKDLYQIQILLLIITAFVTQVSWFFYFIVILSGVQMTEQGNGNHFLMASLGVVISVVDLWLVAYVCGEVVLACDMPGEILKQLSVHNVKDKALKKSIELLSFQMMREKMHLTVCGMFDLDWNTGYLIFQASIMKLIFLVQLDYKNF